MSRQRGDTASGLVKVEFEVLGPVEVRGGAEPLSGLLQRTLLSMLVSRANEPVSVETLAAALWGGARDDRAAPKLHAHIHRLRRVLGEAERLVYGPLGYQLSVSPGELDAARFETLVDEVLQTPTDDLGWRVDQLRKALNLWRGTPYDQVDVPELTAEARRLTDLRLAAAEELFEAELARGRYAAVAAELSELARQFRLRERLQVLVITALYRAGRRADALAVYRDVRRAFVDELGVEPGQALREIEQRVLAGAAVDLEVDGAGAAGPEEDAWSPVVPMRIPAGSDDFVGRELELAELDARLGAVNDHRDAGVVPVALIVGTAGVGKTTLALRWAHHVRDQFPDGQLYVDLRGYGPEQPVPAEEALAGLLRALGVPGDAVPQEAQQRATRFRSLVDGRRMLILVDNAHRVEQVRPLLPGTASCHVLVTSRDALAGLVIREGARRIDLEQLPSVDAFGLFARLVGDRVTAEPEAARRLVDQCARLPLALRVAAELINARTRLTVSDLAAELAEEQGPLDVLEAGGDPQSSVRGVLSWSYQHLPAQAAYLFRLLGLHPGPDIDLPALAALAGAGIRETRRELETLVRGSLVDLMATGRYRSHDLLRAYASELAETTDPEAERQATLGRLVDYYLHTLAAARHAFDPHAAPVVLGRSDVVPQVPTFETRDESLRWYAAECANLVEVITVAVEHEWVTAAWQLATMLVNFFYLDKQWDLWIATHRRVLDAVTRAGDRYGQARLLNGLGNAYDDVHRYDDAIQCHRQAMEPLMEAGDQHAQAWNLNNLGVVYYNLGVHSDPTRFVLALECYGQALELFRAVDDPRGTGLCLSNLADVHRQRGELDEATNYLRRAEEVQQRVGSGDVRRFTLRALGDVRRAAGDYTEAIECYQAALHVCREFGERWRAATLLRRLGDAYSSVGDLDHADDCWRQALAIHQDVGGPEADELQAKLDRVQTPPR